MATKMDSAEKAFEAATLETAAKPVEAPAAPAVVAAPAAVKAAAPAKIKPVKAKAKPVAKKAAAPKAVAKKVAPKKAAVKNIAPKPLKAAPKPVAAVSKGIKTMNDTVKKFADEAKTRTEALTADFNAKAKDAMSKTSKLAEEAVEFNKANIEAMVEAGKIAAKNMEVLGQEGVTFARKSFEDTTAALKGYTSVKSPTEFFKLYAENSKKAFDAAVAQTSKTSELVVKMANDSFAPISNRVSVITSKMKAA
ncbi:MULTISPECIES: phasin family protein [unclassified Sphingopyxis]|jgi:phasin family protein|uniref:phasin family protein n=1 Tax=unclassified Sphingopyxis TaxID=2614943 RepID=UPI00285E0BA8|nr:MULTISPECIES: phasin family protein [unclassified Sphingopyxis]MDR6834552.1 phasin family protein [Sphingopyxis sp. BE122]MDR7226822.1 phasin family protein [Sphingopyxis sp. BE259]